jgi:hypothetical protein
MPLIGSLSLSIAGALNYQTNPREENPDNSIKEILQSNNFPLYCVGIQHEKGNPPENTFALNNKLVKTAILNSILKRQIIQEKCF